MPTNQAANKAAFRRFHEAVGSGDPDVIAKTIDEVVEPDVLFHAPVPTGATGGRRSRRCGTCSCAPSPTCASRSRT